MRIAHAAWYWKEWSFSLTSRPASLVSAGRCGSCSAVVQVLDNLQKFLVLLEPGLRIYGAPQVPNPTGSVNHNGRSALNDEVDALKIETVIDIMRGVCQNRKGNVQRYAILGGALDCIAQNDKYLSASGLKFGI